MFCSKCGKKINESDKFCQQCGTKVDEKASTQSQDHVRQDQGATSNTLTRKIKSWMPKIIFIVVLGLIGWGVSSISDDETFTELEIQLGLYTCSEDHVEQATSLYSNVDYTDELLRLEVFEEEVASMYIDETSQESIDAYNQKYDEYSAWYDDINARITASEGSLEEYNQTMDIYNNYLKENCTRN